MPRLFLILLAGVLTFPVIAQQQDSPLVAAAKRTNRLTKTPAHVITNEDVVATRGRLSGDLTATETDAAVAKPATGSAAQLPNWVALEAASAARLEALKQKAANVPEPPQTEGSSRASYSAGTSSTTNATMSSSVRSGSLPSTTRSGDRPSSATSTNYDQTASASTRRVAPGKKVD